MEKPQKYYRYAGPESSIINNVDVTRRVFRRKEGHFISTGEEVLIKVTPETELLFIPIPAPVREVNVE